MRQNPHVRICGGPGSATTLVYPTASMRNLQIWSPAAQTMIPLRQVVSGFDTTFTDDVIVRQDRRRTITVFADARSENSSTVFARLRPQVEATLDLPLGYSLEWWGEYRDSANAQSSLAGSIPLFIVIMVLMTIDDTRY